MDYSEHVKTHMDRRAEKLQPWTSPFVGAPDDVVQQTRQQIDSLASELTMLSRHIHALAEPAFQERRSVRRIADLLRRHDIAAEIGVAGLETALRAEAGAGGRTIGIVAEYDALPEVGHACGHNIIAAAAVGAFIATAKVLEAANIEGRVVLYGTPAEEGHSGKQLMIDGGAFTDIDAAIMVHPGDADAADILWLGRRTFKMEYLGETSHASMSPWSGRNALDAVVLAYQAIGLLRQQLTPSDRVHAIIDDGGERASVIPHRARLSGYARSEFPETLALLSKRLHQIAAGAAMMTGVKFLIKWDEYPPSMPVRSNPTLVSRWGLHQQSVGRQSWPHGILPDSQAASTDFGNVSNLVPGLHPLIKIAESGVALHSTEMRTAALSAAGEKAVLDASYGLACTALDFLCDDDLAEQVKQDFEESGGVLKHQELFN